MTDYEPLRRVVEDLIDIMHVQTKDLEKLVLRVEQLAGRLDWQNQLSVVASELSELHVRIKKLESAAMPKSSP